MHVQECLQHNTKETETTGLFNNSVKTEEMTPYPQDGSLCGH